MTRGCARGGNATGLRGGRPPRRSEASGALARRIGWAVVALAALAAQPLPAADGAPPKPAPVRIEFDEAALLPPGVILLRQVATVSGGETAGLAEKAGNLSLGPTPLAGNARCVTREQVELSMLRAGYDIARVQWGGANACAVTARTTRITSQEIVQAAKDQLASLPMLRHEDARIEAEEMPRDYIAEDDGIPLRLSAFAASADQPFGRMRVFVQVMARDKTLATVPVMFLVTCKQKALAAARPLSRGQVIEAADLRPCTVVLGPSSVPEAYLEDEASAIGKTAVRATAAGTILTASMVGQPFAVRQGEDVALSVKSSHLEISTRGLAQMDGCIGQMIPVKVFISGKRINCKVVGTDMVEAPL